jgi:hypothetical protein
VVVPVVVPWGVDVDAGVLEDEHAARARLTEAKAKAVRGVMPRR